MTQEGSLDELVAAHPVRLKILRLLRDSNKPMSCDVIANGIGVDIRLARDQVAILQSYRLVESSFEITYRHSNPGIAVKSFKLTDVGFWLLGKMGV